MLSAGNSKFHTRTAKTLLQNNFFLLVFLFVLYRILLDVSYIKFLFPVYGNSFLSFDLKVSIDHYIVSWLFFTVSLFLIKNKLSSLSDFFFLLFVIMQITPITSIYGLDYNHNILPVITTVGSIFLIFLILKLPIKKISIPRFTNSNIFLVSFSCVLIGYLVIWSIFSGAVQNINFDFRKVYQFRSINSQLLDIGFMSYLNIWTYKIFTLFVMCYFLEKKKFLLVILLVLIQTYFYAVTAHKAVFFYPFLCIVIYYAFHKRSKSIYFLLFMFFIVMTSLLIYIVFSWHWPATMMIRRIFFVQPRLTFEWFDFFANNPHVFWSNKFLSHFLSYPYTHGVEIPYIVGEHLLTPELCANNGFVSSGYAHAGVWGIIFYAIILGFIFRVFDSITLRGIPFWFVLSLTATPIWALGASDLFTVLLSHGLLVAFFILLLIDAKELNNYNRIINSNFLIEKSVGYVE